jgi:hypothetical protein
MRGVIVPTVDTASNNCMHSFFTIPKTLNFLLPSMGGKIEKRRDPDRLKILKIEQRQKSTVDSSK